MTVPVIAAGVFVACALLVVGVRDVVAVDSRRRALISDVLAGDDGPRARRSLARWERRFRATRTGAWVAHQLVLAGEDSRPAIVVAGGGVLFGLLVGWVLAAGLAPVFGVLGVVVVVVAVRGYLKRGQDRRREAFIAQMPELARVLANGTSAGMSITSAIALAAQELPAPAGPELARVSQRMSFGGGLEQALGELEERLPSREVAVLTSTLLVSARSGGSLVSALRDIAATLEERKEVRREVKTTLAQSTFTGYLVILMGVGILFLLNAIQEGTVAAMTREWLGRGALLVTGSLFAGGFLAIRRMTRFDG